ncbi:MAG: Uma2 family endonuclease [Rhodoferax sp.]|nr:Uma2 family endonuclease [Rhodoferax sp.]
MFRHIANYFHGKSCRPFVAPFDVRLPRAGVSDHEVDTVVQPDISLVCDPKTQGQPWLLWCARLGVEVLSPSTAARPAHQACAV